jgi:DNA-binding NarL/FixJ family response regulator
MNLAIAPESDFAPFLATRELISAPNPNAVRVFIAEDHHITLWGLSRLIDASAPRFRLVGTASSRRELLEHPGATEADVILLDLDLGGEDSASALAELRLRCPGRVLILTGASDAARHFAAVRQGARGVVHKSEPAENILRAISKVHRGEVCLNIGLMEQLLGRLTESEAPAAAQPSDPEAQRIASLTPREREIVSALARSGGAKQFAVAVELGMSENTLRNHLTTIYSKLGVRGRLELHVYAAEHGLGAEQRPRG